MQRCGFASTHQLDSYLELRHSRYGFIARCAFVISDTTLHGGPPSFFLSQANIMPLKERPAALETCSVGRSRNVLQE